MQQIQLQQQEAQQALGKAAILKAWTVNTRNCIRAVDLASDAGQRLQSTNLNTQASYYTHAAAAAGGRACLCREAASHFKHLLTHRGCWLYVQLIEKTMSLVWSFTLRQANTCMQQQQQEEA